MGRDTTHGAGDVSEMVNQEPEKDKEQQQGQDKPRLKRRSSIIRLKEKARELKEKNEELLDKYRRLYADFDNYKKRSAKEWLERNKEAGKDTIIQLLPVLDDFERALKTIKTSEDLDSIRAGYELIYNKLKKNLEQKGLEPM